MNVLIDQNKLDVLATAISNKSGEPLKLTIAEMVEAVDGIETGGGGITPTGNIDITQAGVTDVTNYATAYVPTATADCGGAGAFYTDSGVRKWRYSSSAYAEDAGWVDAGTFATKISNYNAVPTGTAITPTESAQTVGGSNYHMEGAVTVNAIPSTYVGSGIQRRSRDDLSGDYDTDAYWVDGPAGYYADNFDYEVPNGTEGTPTASKGAVSNHAVQVTPSVTNAAGYITGGTKTGTPVTVTAAELVSGSQTLTENNTYNVADLEEVVVNVASGSSKNAQVVQSTTRTSASTLTAIGAELTVSKTGTYDIYYSCFRTNTSASYTWATRLYINGTAYGTAENATWTNNQQNTHLSNISLTTGDKLRVYGRNTRGTSYYICAPMLVIVEA